ncbi:MAG: acylneuraminate cytidylyltransferase family protein [Pseudomonadota bacterium]|nr:acylneuraminate cytidylyltransferase family protein [Pseudomonadota bacterium]
MKVLAIIPARGGSKGIPHKNIRELAGKPLIAYSIEAARAASGIDRIIVSTDDVDIADISRSYGAEILMRPSSLAEDQTPTRDVLWFHACELQAEGYRPDVVLTLQPTSPLRKSRHIEEAIKLFLSYPNADSLVSCVRVPHHFHPRSVMKINDEGFAEHFLDEKELPLRRQDKSPVIARNGAAIYLTRTPNLRDYVFGGNLLPYMMNAVDSLDIDTFEDFELAEKVLLEQKRLT